MIFLLAMNIENLKAAYKKMDVDLMDKIPPNLATVNYFNHFIIDKNTLGYLISVPPLINFSKISHPRHSYSTPTPINFRVVFEFFPTHYLP